jgi:DNA-binding XRE family transcriptional regulator
MSVLDDDNIKKKEAFHLYSTGMSKNKIAQTLGIARNTVLAWSKKGDWDEKLKAEKGTVVNTEGKLVPIDIEEADLKYLQTQTINKGMRTIYTLMSKIEEAVLSGQESDLRINIKTLVDALDKFYRLQIFLKDGGVSKKEVHVKQENVDWTSIIKESIKAKQDHGDDFDEKEFVRKAVEQSFGKE